MENLTTIFKINSVFLNELSQLGNILNLNEMKEIFIEFKIKLSLIIDENLKLLLVKLFTNLISKDDINSHKSEIENIKRYIDLLLNSNSNSDDKFLNLFCVLEINYLILFTLCKNLIYSQKMNFNLNENIFLYSNKFDEDTIVKDLYWINNINEIFNSKFFPFLQFLNEFNQKLKNKEFFTIITILDKKCSEFSQSNKIVVSNFEYFLDVIFFSLKYIFSPANSFFDSNLNINSENFGKMIKLFFKVIFEYLLINYKIYEKTFNSKICNFPYFENFLMFSSIMNSVVTEIKFFPEVDKILDENLNENSSFDYTTFFPDFSEHFLIFFYNCLKFKIITKFNEMIQIIENNIDEKKLDSFYFAPFLLNITNEGMKDFIICHCTASLINDNNYEIYQKNLFLKIVIECFTFSNVTEKIYKIIVNNKKFNKNLLNENYNEIFSDNLCFQYDFKDDLKYLIENTMNDMKIILPIKLTFLKEILTLNNLIIINFLLIKFPFLSKKLSENLEILNLIEILKNNQNKFYFVLCCNILKLILREKYVYNLRIYLNEKNIYDYFDIKESQQQTDNLKEDEVYVDMESFSLHEKENLDFNMYNLIDENEMNFKTPEKTERKDLNNISSISSNKNNLNLEYSTNNKNKNNFNSKTEIKFEITQNLLQNISQVNLNINLFKSLNKKISVTNPSKKNNSIILKVKIKNNPASIILFKKENNFELFEELNYTINLNSNCNSGQSIIFLKELLHCEMIDKTEMDYILQLENIPKMVSDSDETIKNLINSTKFYIDELSYEETVGNMINLLK